MLIALRLNHPNLEFPRYQGSNVSGRQSIRLKFVRLQALYLRCTALFENTLTRAAGMLAHAYFRSPAWSTRSQPCVGTFSDQHGPSTVESVEA